MQKPYLKYAADDVVRSFMSAVGARGNDFTVVCEMLFAIELATREMIFGKDVITLKFSATEALKARLKLLMASTTTSP